MSVIVTNAEKSASHPESQTEGETGIMAAIEALWDGVRSQLRSDLGEHVHKSWLQPLAPREFRNGRLVLAAPTRFMRDWVGTHYHERILAQCSAEWPEITELNVVVDAARPKARPAGAATPTPVAGERVAPSAAMPVPTPAARSREGLRTSSRSESASGGSDLRPAALQARTTHSVSAAPECPGQSGSEEPVDFGSPLDSRFTFGNFVTGPSNELACAAARRVAGAPNGAFNPLFLHGGVGLGKTHLMHAIAWEIREKFPELKVVYLSAEKFMHQFVRALMDKTTVAFKERFRSVDVLMIDDIQFICGKGSTQEEFFHTFNALVDQKKQIILAADKAPSDLDGLEERVRSRLGWGLVADIQPTTYDLRLGILQSRVDHLDVEIPENLLEFLAHRISSNVRELEGALNRVVAHATLVGRPVTLETARGQLQDLLRANDRKVTAEDIQKHVAGHFKIAVSEMQSSRRARQVARPRQIAMYLTRHLTALSLPDIGRRFGGRDHSTVLHACRKVEALMESDSGFSEEIDLLRSSLES